MRGFFIDSKFPPMLMMEGDGVGGGGSDRDDDRDRQFESPRAVQGRNIAAVSESGERGAAAADSLREGLSRDGAAGNISNQLAAPAAAAARDTGRGGAGEGAGVTREAGEGAGDRPQNARAVDPEEERQEARRRAVLTLGLPGTLAKANVLF